MERVTIYIDGSNLYHGLKNICRRTDLDFSRFSMWLAKGRQLIRTYYI